MSEPRKPMTNQDLFIACLIRILETGTDRIPKKQALCYPANKPQPARGAKGDEHAE